MPLPAHDSRVVKVRASLASLTQHVELLHRRLLRADGLAVLEHNTLLGTVADVLMTAQRMNMEVTLLVQRQDTPQ